MSSPVLPAQISPGPRLGTTTTASPKEILEDVELSNVQNGFAISSLPLEEDIMQCARLGETGLIEKLFESGKYNAKYKDEEGITPLHWAAINNQYGTCKFLIDSGAEVNVRGGESNATPAMWAAQRCHYYIVNLLMQSGTDPLLLDGQGYNILHLATIDGNCFLLVLLLHQNIPADVPDPQGHTSLMWAAYKGFPACVDLLLRWGANVNATDEKGLAPLHWALVRGSQPCIQKILEYGADRFAITTEGKTPAIVAGEMKSHTNRTDRAWHRALAEQGYDDDALPKTLPLGLTSIVKSRRVMSKFYFLWPFVILFVVITLLSKMAIYAAVPFALISAFALQWLAQRLGQWGPPEYRTIHKTPFLAGVFAGTLFWVGLRWLYVILPSTFTTHPFFNILFAVSYGLTTYSYTISMLEDPGFVPKLSSRNRQRAVIQELFSLWKFDEQNFCIQCMIRKPLRSKHCRRCGRCVAKHDHHCPWINNCVGANNLRHFVVYILCMEVGIVLFVRLVIAHIEVLPQRPNSQCRILSSVLCDLALRDTWTLVLALWAVLQLIWVTMLMIVQLVQISKNQTTYENMKRHSFDQDLHRHHHPHPRSNRSGASAPLAVAAAAASGAAVTPHRYPDSCLSRWKKLLGLDAFMATASDGLAEASSGQRRRRQNPFSRGIITNCRDFWCDAGPLFGKRDTGEAMLGGEVVNYNRMYEPPLGTRGGSGGVVYRGLREGEGGGEVEAHGLGAGDDGEV